MALPLDELSQVLLPIRSDDFQPEGILRSRIFIDFVGKKPGQRKASLLAALKRQPVAEPVFPEVYRKWLEREYGKVELLGVPQTQSQAVRLTHVYVPLTANPDTSDVVREGEDLESLEPADGTSAAIGREVGMLRRSAEDKAEQFQLLIRRTDRGSLYVSGSPGSGKSTFCRWLALVCSRGEIMSHDVKAPHDFGETFPAAIAGRLPLLVPLRDFWPFLPEKPVGGAATPDELEDALSAWTDSRRIDGVSGSLVRAHLGCGSLLLVLDGVDELPLAQPLSHPVTKLMTKVVRSEHNLEWQPKEVLLSGLAAVLPHWITLGNLIVLSSRPYGLTERHARQIGLPEARIELLRPPLRELLIRRWFHVLADDPQAGRDKAQAMIIHLAERSELEDLTASPLLLTAMCVIFDQGMRLPGNRHELYDRIVKVVLAGRYPEDSPQLLRALGRLSVIAYGMHTGEGLGEARRTPQMQVTTSEIDRILRDYQSKDSWDEETVESVIADREQLLSRSGLLIPGGFDKAAFYHPSIQEFLAAQRVLDLFADRLPQVIRDRAPFAGWHLTLSFVFAGLLGRNTTPEKAKSLFQKLLRTLSDSASPTATGAALESMDNPTPRLTEFVGLALVVADCFESLQSRQLTPPPKALKPFHDVCLAGIESTLPIRERHLLGQALGRTGDPRIQSLRDPSMFVDIPAGPYVYGDDNQPLSIEQPFRLSRFPVTNSQFREFVDAGGYRDRDMGWSDEGWAWRTENTVTEPLYWRDLKWNGASQPVVGVSWFEAEAFACWVGGHLPTEKEWEAAARGPTGLNYPWGNDWRDGICNSFESELRTTSPVGMFPASRSSAFGLEDMAGNVWEWCEDWFDTEKRHRVLRGGSWYSNLRYCRSAFRSWFAPVSRYDGVGFRVLFRVRTP